jgi:hypothetical protein
MLIDDQILDCPAKYSAMKIDREVREATHNCHTDFSCLMKEGYAVCKAESLIGKTVLFIKREYGRECSHRIIYGNSVICSCPVRKEIFTRYGI